jgi:hypothetical protein
LANVTAPPGAALIQENVTITAVAPPAGLPGALTSVGAAVDVSVDTPTAINMPFLITLPYNPSGVPDENNMAVVHYNTTTNEYEPVTILSQDTVAHTFQIESRSFSPFVIAWFASALLPSSYSVTGFDPSQNGWNIPNFGGLFTGNPVTGDLGGHCLGMSTYAVWYFDSGLSPSLTQQMTSLDGEYPLVANPNMAQLIAVRAQLAESSYWGQISGIYQSALGSAATGLLMKMYLSVFRQPIVLLLGLNGNLGHASVLYGYDSSGFTFYDVNYVNSSETVPFNGNSFGNYIDKDFDVYNSFAYDTWLSTGRDEDFSALTTDALNGFASSSTISVTSPTSVQPITGYTTTLSGTLSSSLNPAAYVIPFVNEQQQTVTTTFPSFSGTIPIQSGDNEIVLVAGADISQQSAWYANGSTLIFNAEGPSFPLVGQWTGTATVIQGGNNGSPYGEMVDATVTQTGNGLTATVVFTDASGTFSYTETANITGNDTIGWTFSLPTITDAYDGGQVNAVNVSGTASNNGLTISGTGGDATTGITGSGTITISADFNTITTTGLTDTFGDSIALSMTRVP